jgi:hypothetical protein
MAAETKHSYEIRNDLVNKVRDTVIDLLHRNP